MSDKFDVMVFGASEAEDRIRVRRAFSTPVLSPVAVAPMIPLLPSRRANIKFDIDRKTVETRVVLVTDAE